MIRKPYSKKLRQLKFIEKRLAKHFNGTRPLSISAARTLAKRCAQLIRMLHRHVSWHLLAKPALAASLILGSMTQVLGQHFEPAIVNPFQTEIVVDAIAHDVVDIDDDGDLDLFIAGYNPYDFALQYQENTGTSQAPVFGKVEINPFGIQLADTEYFFFEFADLDNDGDYDILAFTEYFYEGIYGQQYTYYENTGSPTEPAFGPGKPMLLQSNAGQQVVLGAFPALADLDDDGDIDILSSSDIYDPVTEEYSLVFVYHENLNNPDSLEFAPGQLNPFNLPVDDERASYIPGLGDLDGDGDLDMMAFGVDEYLKNANFFYLENIGSADSASFAPPAQDPFGLLQPVTLEEPLLVDIDDDGDLDLFNLSYDLYLEMPIIQYYQNVGGVSTEFLTGFESVKMFPNPVNDLLSIRIDSQEPGPLEILVFDMHGMLVRQKNAHSADQLSLSMQGLIPGIYHIQIVQGERRAVKKIALNAR